MTRTTALPSTRTSTVRVLAAGGAALAACVATAAPAAAVTYGAPLLLPAPLACDFDVTLQSGDEDKLNTRTFTDSSGNRVQVVTGAAESLVVSGNGHSVTVPSRGVHKRITTTASDGSQTFDITGHLLLILFATDLGGDGLLPTSTTLIAGRTVFTVDPAGVYTVQSVTGRTTDICAALR